MRIRIEDLHKSFDGTAVLRGVDLEVEPGGIHIIVGGSGAGKSVLLKHLVGLLKPDSGRVLIDGEDITGRSERDLIEMRQRFGMIFQSGGMLQSLTVGENVALALEEIQHLSKKDIRTLVDEKLAAVGLEGRADQAPSTLSGGQRKRAAIARALTTRADCLLFDEPTAGLDPPMAANVDELIREVNDSTGATVIVVTHDLISVFEIADAVSMIHEGRIIFTGATDELAASDDPRIRAFLEREFGEAHRRGRRAPSRAR